jgi:hypothetical protein
VGLQNNVPTPLMRTTLHAWPEGTPGYVNHRIIKEYIQDLSKENGVEEVTRYGTRVTKLHKEGQIWQVTSSVLHEDISAGKIEEVEEIKVLNFLRIERKLKDNLAHSLLQCRNSMGSLLLLGTTTLLVFQIFLV